MNLKFRRIRVSKLLYRSREPNSLLTKKLIVSLRGFDTHVDATNITGFNVGEMRNYFFSLPVGEGEFTSYQNRTSGDGGNWDFETQHIREIENQFEINISLDDEPFVALEGEELFIELTFSI